jgi:hypothetical protein
MIKNIAVTALLICCFGCGSKTAVPNGTGLTLMSAYHGFSYTAWLNGEPMDFSYAQSASTLYDFPLLKGSNHLTIKVEISPPPEGPPVDIRFTVLVRDKPTNQANWTQVDDFDESEPFETNSFELESDFQLKSPVETWKDFDSIKDNRDSWEHRVQQLGLAFTTKLSEGNESDWKRIWGPGSDAELQALRMRIHSIIGFTMKPITEPSEIMVESGNYVMLLHARTGALIQFFVNGEVQKIGYSGFRFARSRGKWYVLAPHGHWWKLPDDLQQF